MYNNFQIKKNPCFNKVTPYYLLGEPAFFARGEESPSTLVSGLVTTALPLGFYIVHPILTPRFTLHYLHRRHQQSRPSSSRTVLSIEPRINTCANPPTCVLVLTLKPPGCQYYMFPPGV